MLQKRSMKKIELTDTMLLIPSALIAEEEHCPGRCYRGASTPIHNIYGEQCRDEYLVSVNICRLCRLNPANCRQSIW